MGVFSRCLFCWLQAQAKLRLCAREAARAQESEEAFAAETKKGRGRGRGKGKGKGRGKGRGRGKKEEVAPTEFEEEANDHAEDMEQDLANMQRDISTNQEPQVKCKRHAKPDNKSPSELATPQPPAMKRLALLRSKSKSGSFESTQKLSRGRSRKVSAKRRLDFDDSTAQPESNKKPRKNLKGKGQGKQRDEQGTTNMSKRKASSDSTPPSQPKKSQKPAATSKPKKSQKPAANSEPKKSRKPAATSDEKDDAKEIAVKLNYFLHACFYFALFYILLAC